MKINKQLIDEIKHLFLYFACLEYFEYSLFLFFSCIFFYVHKENKLSDSIKERQNENIEKQLLTEIENEILTREIL